MAIILGIVKLIEFRDERKGKILIKLDYFNILGLFGSTENPYLIITITNFGRKERKILKPNIKYKEYIINYKPVDEAIKYPRKLDSGDQIEIKIDAEYIASGYWIYNSLHKISKKIDLDKFDFFIEVKDTWKKKYHSNRICFTK